jgi:hypothetical protein
VRVNESVDEGEVRFGLGYRMETYHQILEILSEVNVGDYIQYNMVGYPAAEISGRLANVSRSFPM